MYKEPTGQEMAGPGRYKWPPSPYDVFMNEQNIPIYRGIGAYDIRELPLAPWRRMGGRGTFIELGGQDRLWGMYLVEAPTGGALNAERHMYEEMFLVIEGSGSTEIWRDGSTKKQTFEWQAGSHFSVPINVSHRLVNASNRPALVLVATSARAVMDLFRNDSFVFDNPFQFLDRYDESEDYFRPRDKLESQPGGGGARLCCNLLPDIIRCYLPLDNRRAPGHRHMFPVMVGNTFLGGHLAEYPSGRYSKAHYHDAGAVLVCLKGKGYTYNWPLELGPRPWEAGKGHLVKRQDYVAGGMVAAAPGPGNWFHQHFSIGKEPLRERAIISPKRWRTAGEEIADIGVELGQGGRAVSYREEDPQIRKDYIEALEREGVEFQMPQSVYA